MRRTSESGQEKLMSVSELVSDAKSLTAHKKTDQRRSLWSVLLFLIVGYTLSYVYRSTVCHSRESATCGVS